VDDDLATREMVVEQLREEGFDATSVGSVDEALEILQRERFEAIVSDIQMPAKDGFSLLSALRDRNLSIPVILMTSFGASETTHAALEAGAFDCLLKPFPREALLDLVGRAIEAKTLPEARGARA
jgi:DNA-binding NtrC family response regulator